MFHQNNTTSIYQRLKNARDQIQLYPDGIGIKNGVSFRLSHFQKNMTNSSLIKIAFLLSLAIKALADSTYFAIPNQNDGTNYKLETDGTFGPVIAAIQNGTCGANKVDHAVDYGYDSLQTWGTRAQLLNGAGDPLYGVTCLIGLIQNLINEQDAAAAAQAQAQANAANAARAQAATDANVLSGEVVGGVIGGLMLLLCCLMCAERKMEKDEHRPKHALDSAQQDSSSSDNVVTIPRGFLHTVDIYCQAEKKENADDSSSDKKIIREDHSASEKDDNDSISYNTFSRLFNAAPPKIEEEKKEETMVERLAAAGIDDLSKYPEAQNFICPITLVIMTHPAVTDDGMSYERAALEKMMQNAGNCPQNGDRKITTITPNNVLRGQIIEFVERVIKLKKEEEKPVSSMKLN